MLRILTRALGLVLLLLLLGGPTPLAFAQAEEDPGRGTQAGEHFDRGMEFFEEGRHDAALAEFQRAYDLEPAYQVLYNLGRVHAELGHAVQAADAFEGFLEQGGSAVPRAQRREVETALRRQRSRIARLTVEANVGGAIVSVDGVDVARTPLSEPIRVSAGSHTVGIRAPGYEAIRRGINVAGGVEEHVAAELRRVAERSGTLRITSSLPDVTVTVNDVEVGTTPLDSTVPVNEGTHVVMGRRPGYEPTVQHVQVAHNAEVELRLRLRRSDAPSPDEVGVLQMQIPDAPHVLRVDDETIVAQSGRVSLPVGHHRLRIEVADRLPYEAAVNVDPGADVDVVLLLMWTPEVFADRVAEAKTHRRLGMGLTIGGGAMMVGSLAVLGWNQSEINATDAEIRELRECQTRPGGCTAEEIARGAELEAQQPRQNRIRAAMIVTTGLGFAAGAAGAIIWARTPSEAEIEASARAVNDLRLDLGPSGLRLRGTF